MDILKIRNIAASHLPFFHGFKPADVEAIASLKSRQKQGDPWRPKLAKEGKKAELLIYDQIGLDWWTGEGYTPKRLEEDLASLRPFDSLTVRINSPGGDVWDGMTIYNVLSKIHEEITVEIEGIAASAASFIAQAADPGQLKIHEAAQAMIHLAWTGAIIVGNKHAVKGEADKLYDIMDRIDNQIAEVYAARSKRPAFDWIGLMEAETYMTGREAVREKFADEVIPLNGNTEAASRQRNRLRDQEVNLRLRALGV